MSLQKYKLLASGLPRGLNSQIVAKPTITNYRRSASAAQQGAQVFSANADNVTIGIIDPDQLPLATTTTPGIVQPDETTIHVDTTGIINAITATSTTLGIVKPDNVTITIAAGVLTSVGAGSGTVTSVGLSLPGEFSITGSPVTTSGTLTGAWANETANKVFAGPTTGSPGTPTFRTIVPADLPLATSTAFGVMKPDNTTITISAGIISSIGGASGANPTATGGPTVVNGVATTFMRSDAAPAIQLGSASQKGLLQVDGTTITASSGIISTVNSGTVTSVGLSAPAEFTVSGSPVTGSGTLTLAKANETANTVWAGPTTGSAAQPTFRALVAADIPSLPYASTTLTSAHFLVGNVSNIATDVAMAGDNSLSATGQVIFSAQGIARIMQRIFIGL